MESRMFEIKDQIMHVLQNKDFGETTKSVAEELGRSRQTIKKYLEELVKEGKLISHEVGTYTLYKVKRKKYEDVVDVLYMQLLVVMKDLEMHYDDFSFNIITYFRKYIRLLLKNMKFPVEVQIASNFKKQKRVFSNLVVLVDNVREILFKLMPGTEPPRIEVISPLGNIEPMSLLLQVEDRGLIEQRAELHYFLIAILIEEKLSNLLEMEISFKVAQPIKPGGQEVFYELGFIEKYFQDFSLHVNNTSMTDRVVLNKIERFYDEFTDFKKEILKDGEKIHYKLLFTNNRDVEEAYETMIRVKTEGMKAGKELEKNFEELRLREWISVENWQKEPYVVIDVTGNIGYLVNEHIRISQITDKFTGICAHYEKIRNGWRISCLEKPDFLMLFTPITDWKGRKKVFEYFTPNYEEFIAIRQKIVIELRERLAKKRFERYSQL